MGKSLVIVESPAKAKTINKFLGRNFIVMASVGHVKDLPKSKLGVDVEKGFEPQYVKIKGKAKILSDLKKAGKAADNIYLAPDPDREGEAIAWHIASEIDKDGTKTSRVLFNEITEKAVKAAIKVPIKLDRNKYEAQQARRILDRLVGYQVSPILWDKVRRGLSAGRVQSVAVRLICERESAISAFKPREYWSLTAELLTPEGKLFSAKLAKRDGKKMEIVSEAESSEVLADLEGAQFSITDVTAREVKRKPTAPFTTSKLQMDASRKLGFSAKKTMMVAQQLYEGIDLGKEGPIGLITYMRTDSMRLSAEAVGEAREHIKEVYGAEYLPAKPIEYKSKKKTQDAHEAIRPTYVRYPPEGIKANLTKDQLRLYTLIWNRFISCQMAPAVFDQTRAQITAGRYIFTTAGSVMKFAGFMAVYTEAKEKEEETLEKESDGTDVTLPKLVKGSELEKKNLSPAQHFTQPPPRFTEASLVKELEENGIGRPSTYAAILSTVQDRGYVEKEQRQLKPTELGVLVTDMLVENFPDILNVEFTAHMEEELDKVEDGSVKWRDVMAKFYGPFHESVVKAQKDMKNIKGEEIPTDILCEKCSKPMVIKWGRLGKFLACSGYPDCKSTTDFTTDESGKVIPVDTKVETDEKCPKCSAPMVVKSGRFGRFLACTKYPDCKSTKAISTKVPCGEEGCDGKLVERRTKRNRVFYGCSNYPKCEYAVWKLPKGEGESE
jgi:DNA topoisomerase-1